MNDRVRIIKVGYQSFNQLDLLFVGVYMLLDHLFLNFAGLYTLLFEFEEITVKLIVCLLKLGE